MKRVPISLTTLKALIQENLQPERPNEQELDILAAREDVLLLSPDTLRQTLLQMREHEKGGVIMNTEDALRERLVTQEQILLREYPNRIHELANLLNSTREQVQYAIEYASDQSHQSKYVIVNHLLMFHRVINNHE